MSDRYQGFTDSPLGKLLVKNLGLPNPTKLKRYHAGDPLVDGTVVVGGRGRLAESLPTLLDGLGIASTVSAGVPTEGEKFQGLVFDATGITEASELVALEEFFQPLMRSLASCPRAIVIGTPPEQVKGSERVAQRALEGFTRSLGKEIGKGGTSQLVYVADGAEGAVSSTLGFLLSPKSAYVSGQVIRIGGGASSDPLDWDRPHTGRVAVVTGASRGIGAAIARTLARDGATVVGVDVPAQGEELAEVVNEIGGESLLLDITDEDAPARLAEHLKERHGGADAVVHNAGVTRDRTIARMSEQEWDMVLAINLTAQERLNEALLDGGVLRDGGRIVTVSSIGGIAGNRGQTNYGASKAGVIGIVETLAPVLAERGQTINAVAPGFIETKMTAAMPLGTREAGRRMNSLAQGGLPVDVAETIGWLASPASGGVNGNVVRVCGQSLIGA